MKPRHLVRLFPRTWRARYGAEFEALLDASDLTRHDVLDILRHAAGEWVATTMTGRVVLGAFLSSLATVVALGLALLAPAGVVAGQQVWTLEFSLLFGVVDDRDELSIHLVRVHRHEGRRSRADLLDRGDVCDLNACTVGADGWLARRRVPWRPGHLGPRGDLHDDGVHEHTRHVADTSTRTGALAVAPASSCASPRIGLAAGTNSTIIPARGFAWLADLSSFYSAF